MCTCEAIEVLCQNCVSHGDGSEEICVHVRLSKYSVKTVSHIVMEVKNDDDDDDDDELNNLYSAITLDSREYYTSRALTTAEKKFETSVS